MKRWLGRVMLWSFYAWIAGPVVLIVGYGAVLLVPALFPVLIAILGVCVMGGPVSFVLYCIWVACYGRGGRGVGEDFDHHEPPGA